MPGESGDKNESEAWSGCQFPAERCPWKMCCGAANLALTKTSKTPSLETHGQGRDEIKTRQKSRSN